MEQTRIDKAGIYRLTNMVYHADPCIEPSLSASIGRILYDRSPLHAWMIHPRFGAEEQVVSTDKQKRLDLGNAAHSVLLENDWESIEVVNAPDWRTSVAKQARAEARFAGKTPILASDVDQIEARREVMQKWGPISSLGKDGAGNNVEAAVIWQDELGPWCRVKPDIQQDLGAVIRVMDLKTIQGDGISPTPESWGRSQIWDYAMQHGLYRRGVRAVLNTAKPIQWLFVVQENSPPYGIQTFDFDEAGYEYADALATWAIKKWHQCVKENLWPCYPAGMYQIEAPRWIKDRLQDLKGE